MTDRPSCYPSPPAALLSNAGQDRLPLLDILTSPVPSGQVTLLAQSSLVSSSQPPPAECVGTAGVPSITST
ncbi:MAG TPA: hypothetical protein VGQ93_17640 [Lysobacter sp.]|jgi:hypothetical protein|nr:hypothetical protein [Lysobacter sp.]